MLFTAYVPGDEVRRIREALTQAAGRPISPHEFGARLSLPADSFAVDMMEARAHPARWPWRYAISPGAPWLSRRADRMVVSGDLP